MTVLFIPKAGGKPWTATVDAEMQRYNGFDVILMLDQVDKTDDSGWMLELAIERSGAVTGQITAHPGYDALATFTCTQDTLEVFADSAQPACVITDREGAAPAVDPLAVAIKALREVHSGASVTGRWFDPEESEAVGHDDGPEAGYYDRDNPPEGYDADGYCGFDDDRPDPDEPLKPCDWEAYTLEEQSDWLDTCAGIARAALAKIGVPLTEGEG